MRAEIAAFSKESEYLEGKITGYEVKVPAPKHESETITVTVVESASDNFAVPYLYTEITEGQRKRFTPSSLPIVDKMQYEALKALAVADVSVSDWAKKTAALTEGLWETIKTCKIGEDAEFLLPNGNSITITPCSDTAYKKPIPDIEHMDESEIDFYLTNDNIVNDCTFITEMAVNIVNYEKGERQLVDERKNLQDFYEKNIYPHKDTPYSELTEKQQGDFDFYSDWHKELYGFRPHDDKCDMGYQIYLKKESEKKDLSSKEDYDYR
jgi:hypothetical protein